MSSNTRRPTPMKVLVRAAASAFALIVVAWLHIGLHVAGFIPAVEGAVILALVNAFLRPVLILLTLPVTVLSLGLFTLVLNALLFWGVMGLVPGLSVTGFFPALWSSLLVGGLTWALTALFHV